MIGHLYCDRQGLSPSSVPLFVVCVDCWGSSELKNSLDWYLLNSLSFLVRICFLDAQMRGLDETRFEMIMNEE